MYTTPPFRVGFHQGVQMIFSYITTATRAQSKMPDPLPQQGTKLFFLPPISSQPSHQAQQSIYNLLTKLHTHAQYGHTNSLNPSLHLLPGSKSTQQLIANAYGNISDAINFTVDTLTTTPRKPSKPHHHRLTSV